MNTHAKSQRREKDGKFAPEGKPAVSASTQMSQSAAVKFFDAFRAQFDDDLHNLETVSDRSRGTPDDPNYLDGVERALDRLETSHRGLAEAHDALNDVNKQSRDDANRPRTMKRPNHQATLAVATTVVLLQGGKDILHTRLTPYGDFPDRDPFDVLGGKDILHTRLTPSGVPDEDDRTTEISFGFGDHEFDIINDSRTSNGRLALLVDDDPKHYPSSRTLYAQQPIDTPESIMNLQGRVILEDRVAVMKERALGEM